MDEQEYTSETKEEQAQAPEKSPPTHKHEHFVWIATVVMVLLVIVAGFAYFSGFKPEQALDVISESEKIIQEMQNKNNTESAVFLAQEGIRPLGVEIEDPITSNDGRTLLLNAKITNKTADFVDNVYYVLEIYKGDQLQDEGDLFSALDFTISKIDWIGQLSPNEKSDLNIKFDLPDSFEPGTYFVRFVVNDKEGKYFGIDFSEKSVQLSGNGGFLGSIKAYFRTSHGDDGMDMGWPTYENEKAAIVIPLSENPKLETLLQKKKALFLESSIQLLASNMKTVKEIPMQKVETKLENGERKIIYELYPDEKIVPGPYWVHLNLVDENEEMLAEEIVAHWVVEGFNSRIKQLETRTNFYKKDFPVDLKVSLTTSGAKENQKAVIEANFETVGQKSYEFQKEFDLVDGEDTAVDFYDQKFPNRAVVKNVNVKLKDKGSGRILDEVNHQFKTDENYVNGTIYQNESTNTSPVQNKQSSALIVMLIFLVFVLAGIFIFANVKKRDNRNIGLLLLFVLGAFAMFLPSSNVVQAGPCGCDFCDLNCLAAHCGVPHTNVSISFNGDGNLGTCSKTANVDAFVSVTCSNCLNGISGNFSYSGGLGGWWPLLGPGHVGSHVYGPYRASKGLNNGSPSVNFTGSASFTHGCWCGGGNGSKNGSASCNPYICPAHPSSDISINGDTTGPVTVATGENFTIDWQFTNTDSTDGYSCEITHPYDTLLLSPQPVNYSGLGLHSGTFTGMINYPGPNAAYQHTYKLSCHHSHGCPGTSDSINVVVPTTPMTVQIGVPDPIQIVTPVTWTANVSGGVLNPGDTYDITWSGGNIDGSGLYTDLNIKQRAYTYGHAGPVTVTLTAVDSWGQVETTTRTVDGVDNRAPQ